MKSTLIRIALVAALLLPNIMHAQEQQQRLSQHVYTLASDSLRGRKAGTPDGLRAAQYIVGQYKDMGLQPLLDDYLVPFTFPNREIDITCNNIIGIIEGSDPVLKRECLVIGAHYDHLGVRLSDNAVYLQWCRRQCLGLRSRHRDSTPVAGTPKTVETQHHHRQLRC